MQEINNLEKLTDKIYQEGVEKAEKESQEIISKAKSEYNRILEEAKKEAKSIVSKAEQKATKIARSAENELQLKGKQMISDLQTEIQGLISLRILENGTSEAFADVPFLQSAILESIKSWDALDGVEVVLPKELEQKLDKSFHNTIKKKAQNLTVTFNDKLKEGFKIVNKADSYEIAFSKDEFIALFSSYLTDKTNQLLFSSTS